MSPTGTVEAGRVVYAAGTLRVAEQLVRVGAASPADILTVTGTTKLVTALDPEARRAGRAQRRRAPCSAGRRSCARTRGRTSPNRTPADDGGAAPKRELTIAVADQKALAGDRVRSPSSTPGRGSRKTCSPCRWRPCWPWPRAGTAWKPSRRRTIVAVTAGMFADGRVEVTGAGLTRGPDRADATVTRRYSSVVCRRSTPAA